MDVFARIQDMINALIAMVMALTTTLPAGSPEYLAKFGGHCTTPRSSSVEARQNLIVNGSFEQDVDRDGIPDSWHKAGSIQANDAIACNRASNGSCSFHFDRQEGELTGYVRGLNQNIPVSGKADTKITLSGWSRAKEVRDAHPITPHLSYVAILTFYDKDGVALPTPDADEVIDFTEGTHDFEYVERTFTPGVDFYCFDIGLSFYERGEVWFDDIRLTLNP
ncbi:MAG TPA: hypothetical protein VJB96_03835 [Patescibacteria group bacterium]|nr:hypothetical protein [Patescibacteria group bacterium]